MLSQTIDGRYRILGELGKGGMGAVYEAEHVGTRRRVAVKVINAEMAEKTEMVRRFHREARAAGAVETSHIVQVLDTGTDASSGMIYMVMELLRGEDLKQLLARLGKLPPKLVLRLLGQAAIGIRKAHEVGVIHRDIKPANLFLAQQDNDEITVKVVDFGIAKIKVDIASSGDAGLTHTGGMLGSPLYMSPEQAKGRKTIDHRTDIWSLGVVLYQALTGQAPHPADSLASLVLAICLEPAPPVQDLAPWVSPEIALIVHRALAINPEARFPTVAAMLEAIRQVVPDGLSVRADALVSLTEAERAYMAPRIVVGSEMTRAPLSSMADGTPLPESVVHSGEAGLSVSQGAFSSQLTPGRARVVAALALSAVIGGGGFAAYTFGSRSRAAAPSSGLSVAALPLVTALPAPAVTPPPPSSDERPVRLAVEPADATVEVAGHELPVKDGVVELRGAVGSLHLVRVRKGTETTEKEVAITLSGAWPPKVQLDVAAPQPSATSRPAANPGGKASRATPMASASSAVKKAIVPAKLKDPEPVRKFE